MALWSALALACSCLPPMLNLVCYVWLYYEWFFVFNCICAVLRGSLRNSCGLSAVKINEKILLLLLSTDAECRLRI